MRICILILFSLSLWGGVESQNLKAVEDYLRLDARADDPLYTTYAAAIKRSRLYGDKAYKMDYYSDCRPVTYSSDQAGSMFCLWKVDEVVIRNIGEYFKKPVVLFSFPDMAILEYEPFRGIRVRETFFVYSSRITLVEMEVTNLDRIVHEVVAYPVLWLGNDSLRIEGFDSLHNGYITTRYESPYRLISSLKMEYGYPTKTRDFFASNFPVASYGGCSGDMDQFYNLIKTDFYSATRLDLLNNKDTGLVDFISLQLKKRLRPGERANFRYIRGVQDQKEDLTALKDEIDQLRKIYLKTFYEDNLILFSKIPRIRFKTKDEKLVYLGAFNLVRSSMVPPSGKTTYNFYVFSRNPLWGWGHGHQVLHESLSMLAYVYMDPESAEGSQRVYIEQQREDGLIAYRHGPRGLQDYPYKNKSTTSAPFFSWINLELYQVSKDKKFLEEAYVAGCKYTDWLIRNRDQDADGTFEWGPYGIIENVRDWYNAVFQVSAERYLDVDKEDISDELECLDLTLMVIKEEKSLTKMAQILGKQEEAKAWMEKAEKTSKLVNERMWDDSTGFYYSVNKGDHGWFFMNRDLRRQELIGFLPLWAGVAPPDRASSLVETLTDTTRFWRRYGIPTLSAADPWYSPNVDYCCKWNGPVWLLWDYMVYDGLKQYGYDSLANLLAGKMVHCVVTQLKKNHNYWESYSPDNEVLNCPSNYIWDAIMARLLIEEYMESEK
ncbi:MAG: trehalase family glycosidase [bacterium]